MGLILVSFPQKKTLARRDFFKGLVNHARYTPFTTYVFSTIQYASGRHGAGQYAACTSRCGRRSCRPTEARGPCVCPRRRCSSVPCRSRKLASELPPWDSRQSTSGMRASDVRIWMKSRSAGARGPQGVARQAPSEALCVHVLQRRGQCRVSPLCGDPRQGGRGIGGP